MEVGRRKQFGRHRQEMRCFHWVAVLRFVVEWIVHSLCGQIKLHAAQHNSVCTHIYMRANMLCLRCRLCACVQYLYMWSNMLPVGACLCQLAKFICMRANMFACGPILSRASPTRLLAGQYFGIGPILCQRANIFSWGQRVACGQIGLPAGASAIRRPPYFCLALS